MSDFERMATAKAGGGNTIALFLGLFLLVLAFFIMLVSISTIENVKSKEVMDSLTSTFSDLMTPVTDPTDFVSMQGEILAPEEFQERIASVFSTDVAVDRIKVIQPGRVMRVDLQAPELFEDGAAALRPGRTELIDHVVTSLSASQKNIRFEMAFLIGSTTPGSNRLPTNQTLEVSRAGSFARTVLERGAPASSISVGIRDGAPSDITIFFYVRDEERARLNLERNEPVKDITYQDDGLQTPGGGDSIPSTVIELTPLEAEVPPKAGSVAP